MHATMGSHWSFKGEEASSARHITGTNGGLDDIYGGCIGSDHLGRHIIVERDKICHVATFPTNFRRVCGSLRSRRQVTPKQNCPTPKLPLMLLI